MLKNILYQSSLFAKNRDGNTKKGTLLVLGVISLLVLAGIYASTSSKGATPQNTQEVKAARATTSVNHELTFPLKDEKGKEISKVIYTIESAELRDEIIVKGTKATSATGRTFLILNLKIKNEYEKAVQVNSRDYVRLFVNGNEEALAPEIHNDPVEVQAISTKYTRIGFPINISDSDLKIKIGEIKGERQEVELKF